ncbi:hypothetical protein JX265_008856 [Neoarthrinium moseri]|uniref:Uncharacterized protein n=1 Tax=Neoarthrinium moseri TaxID=1658444 RepID=A0A9P9WHK1_9PEZI|nr:uncharacterized protein JN550_009572 [Neoarthrinium moseri]KAI1863461.1 hypothetical protein JN550_009572 [Neoarthrinium moseri]KAI1863639.1 hypothetical protein JX265_008856 [Neoarthrinium moseri]
MSVDTSSVNGISQPQSRPQSRPEPRPCCQARTLLPAMFDPVANDSQTGWTPRDMPGAHGSPIVEVSMDDYDPLANLTGAGDDSCLFGAVPMMGALDSPHTIPASLSHTPPQPLPQPVIHENECITSSDLATLHNNYFDTIYPALPWLNKDRFVANLSANPDSLPLLSLSYCDW